MIVLSQDLLHNALKAVTRASTKNSLAALSLVRLDADPIGELRLSCFNGESAVQARVPADCNDSLSVHVDAQILHAVVETLAGQVRLSVEDNALVLQCGANRTTLRQVEEELPLIGEQESPPAATLSGSLLRSLMRVLPFASTDCSRTVLQVLHLCLESDRATALAADGYSAGRVRETIEGPQQSITACLPLGFARLLASLVEERDLVQIYPLDEARFHCRVSNPQGDKNLTLATLAVSEAFPSEQIEALVETARQNERARLLVSQSSLMQSIRMVQAMGTQNTYLKISAGAARIASAETETGRARNLLEGSAEGQPASAWLSAAYLKRFAEAVKGETSLRLGMPQQPILAEAGSFTVLIMPLLLEGAKDPFPEEEALAIQLPEMSAA